jgi:hypothetical protein
MLSKLTMISVRIKQYNIIATARMIKINIEPVSRPNMCFATSPICTTSGIFYHGRVFDVLRHYIIQWALSRGSVAPVFAVAIQLGRGITGVPLFHNHRLVSLLHFSHFRYELVTFHFDDDHLFCLLLKSILTTQAHVEH